MGKKLYVGNLNYDTSEDQLKQLFDEIGTVVSVAIITDRQSGRSKGFGFVEMETESEAQKGIDQYNNVEFMQRSLVVNEARPRRERPSYGRNNSRGGNGGGGGRRPSRPQGPNY